MKPKMTITFFEDNADERYAGHTFDLYKCSWSPEFNCWVEDPEGNRFGIYPPGGKELTAFLSPMEDFGVINIY